MFRSFKIELLSVREYIALGRERSDAIPRVPGIYIWTADLRDIGTSALSRDPDEVFTELQKRISTPRGEPLESGMVGNYRHVAIRDLPPQLTPASSRRMTEMIAARNLHLEWAFLCATMFQRPLNIGKAVNLANRIRSHVKPDSHLSGELERLGLTVSDCTVLLLPVQSPDNIADLVAVEEERIRNRRRDVPYSPSPSEILNDESQQDEEGDAYDLDAGAGDDLNYDVQLEPEASAELKQVDQLVRLAESLTIRVAHPLLNMKMD